MKSNWLQRTAVLSLGLAFLSTIPEARADVAPPAAIKMPKDTPQAVSGEEYAGVFEIHVFRAGVLADFKLEGEGWTVLSLDTPADPGLPQIGMLRIPFRAVPRDADRPIRLSFTCDGRRVSKEYEVGPKYFGRVGQARAVKSVGVRLEETLTVPLPQDESEVEASLRDGAIPLRFTGRFIYTRSDGRTVGADNILVEVMDDDGQPGDALVDETICWGYTDVNGYFDSGVISWDDCDVVGCDEPDIYVRFECDTPVGQVQEAGILEEDYSWSTMGNIHEDFTGSEIHFGTIWPSDAGQMPALHIWNSLVRAHRYIGNASGINVDHVDIQWPETGSSTSYYIEFFDEIYIIAESEWKEGTLTHEYGHHFMANHSVNQDPDYCNDYCDGEEPCTSGTDCEDPGHCLWCPENNNIAWNEGVPNWLADTVLRSYPRDYQFDDCTPYTPIDTRGYENIDTCCQDGQLHDPWSTEGFVSALLRDIDDERDDAHDENDDDDHGTSGITDCMDIGPEEILTVVVEDQPTTPNEFISMFRSRYPQHTPGLWKTAQNVHPDYVTGFPADTFAPGPVNVLDSPTHPSGAGGALPCITVEFDQPTDDVTGSASFAVKWTTDPNGIDPGYIGNLHGSCVSQATSPQLDFGEYYVSIRAMDFENHWGPPTTAGPFVINGDCNSNGIMDLCDIACDASYHAEDAGLQCTVSPGFCAVTGCGTSDDCNLNLVPDDCDLASGISKDCDQNGIPDECDAAAGTLIQWADGNGSWHDPDNWYKLSECPDPPPPPTCDSPFSEDCPAVPELADNVCIDVPGDNITVTYTAGDTDIDILACYENLNISGGSATTLKLFEPSWVDGDLGLSGNGTVLEVTDRLDIGGLFTWAGSNVTSSAKLKGPGVTYANGGVHISEVVHLDGHHLVLDGNSTSVVTTGRVDFIGPAVFEIRQGSTYEHQGSLGMFNGWFSDQFVNKGTLIKSVDPGTSSIYMFTENSGLIHVQTGTLKFYLGSSSTGDFLADPGTLLEFNGGGREFLPSSSIVADNVLFSNGVSGANNIRGTYNVTIATTVQGGQGPTFTDEANIISYGSSFYIPKGLVNFNAVVGGPIRFDTLSLGSGYYGGTANFNSGDPVEVTNLTLAPGAITGPSTITVDGLLTWGAGGHFRGPGTVNANGDVLVGPGGGEKTLYERVFNNASTATFLGPLSLSSSGVFNNLAGGIIDIQVDSGASIFGGSGVALSELNNAGTMVKTAGSGTSTISAPTTNTGTVEVQIGELEFYTYYGSFYIQTAGQTVLSGGNLAMFGPAPVQINGGLLTGRGTITGNVVINNTATVAPGLSAGVLDIVGNYTQAAGGTLEIEIDGLNQGSEYDLLTVSGTANIAGNLEVILPTIGFAPVPGDSFQILTAGNVSGEFDPVNVTNLPPYLNMDVVYTDTAVTLEMVGVVPGDCDLDGDADLDDYKGMETCLSGPGSGFAIDCRCFDFDDDSDISLGDFAKFQAVLTGP